MEVSQVASYARFENGRWQQADGAVVREGLVRLHVNGLELTRVMCMPQHLDWLVLGFLRGEGIIQSLGDIRLIKVCPSETCVDVWLHRADFEPPTQRTITSGCGGGITFADLSAAMPPVVSELRVTTAQLSRLMRDMQETQETRGIHTAALAAGTSLLVVVEDVGRHNAIDKVLGYCLMEGISTRDRILLSTGRISSEMLGKAARAGIPVVVSRTSPTSLSVALATAWHVTLVGYARRDSINVHAGQERVVMEEAISDASL